MCFESMAQVEFHFYFQRGAGTSILLLKKFFLMSIVAVKRSGPSEQPGLFLLLHKNVDPCQHPAPRL